MLLQWKVSLRDVEAGGSNPLTPTKIPWQINELATRPSVGGDRGVGHFVDRVLLRARKTRQHDIRLQQQAFQQDALDMQLFEDLVQHWAVTSALPPQRVVARHRHLEFDNGHEPGLLAQAGITRERVGIGHYARAAWKALLLRERLQSYAAMGAKFAKWSQPCAILARSS
jgi:hypothetical protein